jgi:hypothetical protein
MSPLVVAAVYVAVCAAAFLLGLRFFRMTEPRGEISVDQGRRFGRLLMMGATMLVLFLAALWLHGDLKLVRT